MNSLNNKKRISANSALWQIGLDYYFINRKKLKQIAKQSNHFLWEHADLLKIVADNQKLFSLRIALCLMLLLINISSGIRFFGNEINLTVFPIFVISLWVIGFILIILYNTISNIMIFCAYRFYKISPAYFWGLIISSILCILLGFGNIVFCFIFIHISRKLRNYCLDQDSVQTSNQNQQDSSQTSSSDLNTNLSNLD